MKRQNVGRRQRQADVVGRDFLCESMNGVELRDGLAIGSVKPFRCEWTLAHVHDHERDIHAAFDHLRQIDLRGEAFGVVAIRCEVGRLDIVVSVELQHVAVNQFGFGNQSRVVLLRWTGQGCQVQQ